MAKILSHFVDSDRFCSRKTGLRKDHIDMTRYLFHRKLNDVATLQHDDQFRSGAY